jgi:hypothetical protein
MTVPVWRKSPHSGDHSSCVEVAVGPVVGVRDTKDRAGGQLSVSARAWSAVVARLRATT